MSDLCLNLLTSRQVPSGPAALDRIWSLDNWLTSVGRVKKVDVSVDLPDHQHFRLWFDADRTEPDEVEIERFWKEGAIQVVHRVPPPGIRALSASWWVEGKETVTLYARRQIMLDQADYSADLGRKMFALMKENLSKLLEDVPCVPV